MSADFSQIKAQPGAQLAATVNALVDQLRAAQQRAEAAQAEYEAAAKEVDRLAMVEIPDTMAGVESITLEDGSILKVKDDVKASITVDNRPEAHAWLRNAGHGSVIKEALLVDLRGLTPVARDVLEMVISDNDITAEPVESVHPSTLKSLVKELLGEGTQLPPCFSIFEFKKAEVKQPTKGKKK